MKIQDPELLRELYDTEADWKLLIGYRFKGSQPKPPPTNGRAGVRTRHRRGMGKSKKRAMRTR